LSFCRCAVRAFGTENRPTERPVQPRDDVYDFIIFRGSDIKCIDVVEPPKESNSDPEGFPSDPAILEVSNRVRPPGTKTCSSNQIHPHRPLSSFVFVQNSRSQGSSFPKFNGASAGSNLQQQQRQKESKENLILSQSLPPLSLDLTLATEIP